MIVHPPVEAVSLITGQLLPDTMRDDTFNFRYVLRVFAFSTRSIDSTPRKKKERKKKNDRATIYSHRSSTIYDKDS